MAKDSSIKPEFVSGEDNQDKPLIEFHNVVKKFGDYTAVDNLSLTIFEREFFALLGPSGCGKTTLMRMLAGFENPTSGMIMLDGENIVPIPPNKRPINIMFQSYALFPHLTVADNIAFGLRRSALTKGEIVTQLDAMLALVQLEKFRTRKPHQISGGQRQRVALARALARRPRLLLLDEPLGALDKKLRQQTQFELVDIQEKLGTTFVMVTHDQQEAMTMACRIGVMNHGKLVQVASPEQIYEMPACGFVADFIGDINLITGKISKIDGHDYYISWAEGSRDIVCFTDRIFDIGQDCRFAVRPEKIQISQGYPEKMLNVVAGRIIDIAYLGNISTYHIALQNGQMFMAQTVNQNRLVKQEFTWEENVWLSWNKTAGLVLTD